MNEELNDSGAEILSTDEFQKLDQDIISFYRKVESTFNISVVVKYCFLANMKQKELIKISKINKPYDFLTGADLLVQINPRFFDEFPDDINKILIEEKIDQISTSMNTGVVKLVKSKIQISPDLVRRHDFETVLMAKESERSMLEKLENEDNEQNKN